MTDLCPIPPSIETALTERLEWLTDVLTSHNGKEQRIQLRARPRRRIDYAFGLDNAGRARAESFLHAHHGAVVGLPIWPDRARLATALDASAVTIPTTTTHRDYTLGGQVALIRDWATELATISAIAEDALTVSPLVSTWPAGTTIVPVRDARLDARVSTTNPWPAVMRGRLQYLCEAGWTITPATESVDYLGYPVHIPDAWELSGNTDYQRLLTEFDPGTGAQAVYDPSGVEFVDRQYRIALATRADIAAYYAWLAARAGRRNPFWLASGQPDITVIASLGSAQITMTIASIGYADMDQIPTGRRDILIETTSGQRYYRRITAAAAIDADTEQLTLASALGVTLAPAAIARVGFLRLSRLATDSVEIAHHWDGVAESRLTLHTLRDDL